MTYDVFFYSYRWFYASAISCFLLLIGYLYILQPQWVVWQQQQSVQQQLMQQIKKSAQQYKNTKTLRRVPPLKQKDIQPQALRNTIAELVALARTHDLQLQAIQTGEQANKKIHLIMQGHFEKLTAFVTTLLQQQESIMIADFSYQVEHKNTAHISMDIQTITQTLSVPISAVAVAATAFMKKPILFFDPFCRNDFFNTVNVQSQPRAMMQTSTIPVKQMKMVGYVQQGKTQYAWLSLPTGEVIAVHIGNVLGVERGRVTTIAPYFLTLTFSQQPNLQLTM